MFERYEEHARRSIFLSKIIAREFDSPYVEPEHLLLGILRQCPQAVSEIIASPAGPLKDEAESAAKTWPRRFEAVRLGETSLSSDMIHILERAAQEADSAAQEQINPMHLLAAMVAEEKSGVATVLSSHGVTLPKLRARFAYWELSTQLSPNYYVTGSQAGLLLGPEILFVLQDGRAIGSTTTLDYVPRLKERLRLSLERGYTSEFTVGDVRYDYKLVDSNESSSVQRLKTIVIYLKPRHGHDEEEYSSLT